MAGARRLLRLARVPAAARPVVPVDAGLAHADEDALRLGERRVAMRVTQGALASNEHLPLVDAFDPGRITQRLVEWRGPEIADRQAAGRPAGARDRIGCRQHL